MNNRRIILDLFTVNKQGTITEKISLDNLNNEFNLHFTIHSQININLLEEADFILYNLSQETLSKIYTFNPYGRDAERVKVNFYLGYGNEYHLLYTGDIYNTIPSSDNFTDMKIELKCLSNLYPVSDDSNVITLNFENDIRFSKYIDYICKKFNINYVYNSKTDPIITTRYQITGDMERIFDDIIDINPNVDVYYTCGKLYITDKDNNSVKGYVLLPGNILSIPKIDIFFLYIKYRIVSDIKVGDWVRFENTRFIDNKVLNGEGNYSYAVGDYKIYNIIYNGGTMENDFYMYIKALRDGVSKI